MELFKWMWWSNWFVMIWYFDIMCACVYCAMGATFSFLLRDHCVQIFIPSSKVYCSHFSFLGGMYQRCCLQCFCACLATDSPVPYYCFCSSSHIESGDLNCLERWAEDLFQSVSDICSWTFPVILTFIVADLCTICFWLFPGLQGVLVVSSLYVELWMVVSKVCVWPSSIVP